jgi:Flp pilus assembly protein TadG
MNIMREKGVTTVEFAIVGATALLVLFAVIEVGRAMFVLNTLGETTRRAARMAAVCPINDPAITEVALFNPPGGGTGTRIVGGLTPANVAI